MDYQTGNVFMRITPNITGGRRKKSKKNRRKSKKKSNHKENNKSVKQGATVSRISCAEYDDPSKNPNIGRIMPKVGDNVIIIVKPYKDFTCIKGKVQRVLTKRPVHTRGHKVMIENNIVGRTLKIIDSLK